MSAAGGGESSRRHSLDVQKWVWAPASGQLQPCISPLQTPAEGNTEPQGWKKRGIRHLYTAMIIIIRQNLNSTLFFCFLADRLTGLIKVKQRASENGRFDIFFFFFFSLLSLTNKPQMSQHRDVSSPTAPALLHNPSPSPFTPSDRSTYPHRSFR